ncbi:hypothetical protein [Desulfogranum mediterraneum]|uniref:hypothetical protein n=1 Tax=Desulfogranum mediterraneum TaxID=160661 RepID=UPI00040B1A5B|nr:hypothetical protein [Desulfogranum mediterraneum]
MPELPWVSSPSSSLYPNQAFLCRDRLLGLRFHLESSPESVPSLLSHCGHELEAPPSIQSGRELNSPRLLHSLEQLPVP